MTLPASNKTRGHRKAFHPNVVEMPKNSPAKTELRTFSGVSAGLMSGFARRMKTESSIKQGNHNARSNTEIHSLDVPMAGIVPKYDADITETVGPDAPLRPNLSVANQF
jgi:hypothetical protein